MKLENLAKVVSIIICFVSFFFLWIFRNFVFENLQENVLLFATRKHLTQFFPKTRNSSLKRKTLCQSRKPEIQFFFPFIDNRGRERERKNDKISGNQVSTRKKYFFHSSIRDEKWLALHGKRDQKNSLILLIKTNVFVRSISLNTLALSLIYVTRVGGICLHPDRISVFVAVSTRKRYFLRKVVACFLTPRDKISSKMLRIIIFLSLSLSLKLC